LYGGIGYSYVQRLAFKGTAIYITSLPSNLYNTFTELLQLAQILGVGKNRSLGFGHIEISNIKIERISKEK